MPYEITSACNGCGKCEFVCPESAISKGLFSSRYTVDPDLCDSCGSCDYVCPKDAIEPG